MQLEFVDRFFDQFWFGEIGKFTYMCNYKASSSTSEISYQVAVQSNDATEMEHFRTWDNTINLKFFTDDSQSLKCLFHEISLF